MNLIYNPNSLEQDQTFLEKELFNYNRTRVPNYG